MKPQKFKVDHSSYDAACPINPVTIQLGSMVEKVGGDYRYNGVVVSMFKKISGAVRFVVEDDRGTLHIFSEKNLKNVLP